MSLIPVVAEQKKVRIMIVIRHVLCFRIIMAVRKIQYTSETNTNVKVFLSFNKVSNTAIYMQK